jgi:hypothetical protein
VLLATVLASPARAEDGPPDLPRPAPPPRPEVAGLLDRLLSPDAEVRASADAAVAKASPDVLRILFFALRDRAGRAERAGKAGAVPGAEEEETRRSDRGVRQTVRLVSATAEAAARHFGALDATPDAAHRVLTEEEAKALLGALGQDAGVRVLTSPTITAYDRQRASVEVLDQGSYVADMEIREQGGTAVADPVVETYRTGLRIESRARILHDGTSVATALEIEVRRRVEPMAEEALPTREGLPPVRVQRAELVGCRWSRAFTVPQGRTVLVTLPRGFGAPDGRRLAFLCSPSIVALDEGVPAPGAPAAPGGK